MGEWRQVNWSQQALGVKSDTEIARKLGVTRNRVRNARRERGIEPSPRTKIYAKKGIDWDSQPIGKEPDNAIAKRLGVASVTVLNARRTRDIPAFVPANAKKPKKPKNLKPPIDWDEQPLGVETDRGIARELGIQPQAVRRARVERGIDCAPQARKYTKRGIDWGKQPLGKVKDAELAETLGVDTNSVRSARVKRDIPSFKGDDGRKRTHWDNEPLGKIPDQDLALMLGVTDSAVAKARIARDIPPYQKRGVTWTDK